MLEHIFKHYVNWEEYGRVDQKNYDKKFDTSMLLIKMSHHPRLDQLQKMK